MSRPIRVLFFPARDAQKASTRTQAYERAAALRKQGVEADVLIRKEHRNPLIGNKDRFLVFPFVFWRYDIIFFQKTFQSAHRRCAALAKRFGKKIVFHIDDYTPAEEDFGKMVQLADLTLVCSRLLLRMAKRYGPRAAVLPSVVDTDRFPAVQRKPKQTVTLGWLGRGQENLLLITGVLARLAQRHKIRLKVIGKGDPAVVEECRRQGIPLLVTGWIDAGRVPQEMEEFDIALLPSPGSLRERAGMHTKLLEYLASGLPVVCTPMGEIPGVVREGKEGFLPRTNKEWAQRLEQLIADPGLRQRMGAASRERAQRYSMAATTAEMVGRFKQLLGA